MRLRSNYNIEQLVHPIGPAEIHIAKPVRLAHRRLAFLDGIRGFAAIFVMLHHVHAELSRQGDLSPLLERATCWLQIGHYPVAVFIVLSGFSLMLSVLSSPTLQISGGFKQYLFRRARRILPTYYIVLLATILLGFTWPAYRSSDPISWPTGMGIGAILSHVALIHNLNSSWCFAVNPPTWSIATEFQIYLLFPTFLLPMFRRFGGLFTIVIGSLSGIAINQFCGSNIGWTCPWYIGLFAMGMTAAMVTREIKDATSLKNNARWYATGAVVLFVGIMAQINIRPDLIILADFLTGGCTAMFLCWCALNRFAVKQPVIVRPLESRTAHFLGEISYPLYLVHYPVIAATSYWIHSLALPGSANCGLVTIIATALSVCIARLLVEVAELSN